MSPNAGRHGLIMQQMTVRCMSHLCGIMAQCATISHLCPSRFEAVRVPRGKPLRSMVSDALPFKDRSRPIMPRRVPAGLREYILAGKAYFGGGWNDVLVRNDFRPARSLPDLAPFLRRVAYPDQRPP
jgi:hypothetical protein